MISYTWQFVQFKSPFFSSSVLLTASTIYLSSTQILQEAKPKYQEEHCYQISLKPQNRCPRLYFLLIICIPSSWSFIHSFCDHSISFHASIHASLFTLFLESTGSQKGSWWLLNTKWGMVYKKETPVSRRIPRPNLFPSDTMTTPNHHYNNNNFIQIISYIFISSSLSV